jgi:choline dehydrogenase-like flavoprotein
MADKGDSYLENLFGLSGRTAIIVGGTGVLGGALAEGLARAGAFVVVAGRGADRGEARVDAIKAAGGNGMFVSVDAVDRASVTALLDTVIHARSRADILVNCAGVNSSVPYFEIADDDFRRTEPRSLSAHRFARIDFTDDDLAHRLAQLRRRETLHRAPRQCRGNRPRGGKAFRRIRGETDTKKSARTRIPTRRVDRVDQSGFFADFLPQHRAITTAEHGGE